MQIVDHVVLLRVAAVLLFEAILVHQSALLHHGDGEASIGEERLVQEWEEARGCERREMQMNSGSATRRSVQSDESSLDHRIGLCGSLASRSSRCFPTHASTNLLALCVFAALLPLVQPGAAVAVQCVERAGWLSLSGEETKRAVRREGGRGEGVRGC